ncbi:MAG TPA: ADP-ribosylglycohydrolase family protein, partial [Lachnospiraceae bacterium]|nr:ADP-ribosylglycohydrolase family protein [Lachnospiraceae bacterium]
MLAPGKPAIASYLAYQDAMVDHAGGEGVYAEMYNAVLESLAFEESDRETLIEKAVAFLPAG